MTRWYVSLPRGGPRNATVRGIAVTISQEKTPNAAPAPSWCMTELEVMAWLRDQSSDLPAPVRRVDLQRVLDAWNREEV